VGIIVGYAPSILRDNNRLYVPLTTAIQDTTLPNVCRSPVLGKDKDDGMLVVRESYGEYIHGDVGPVEQQSGQTPCPK